MKLDPFYLIVSDSQWAARLVPLGVKLLQLRIKEQSSDEIRRQVREARRICSEHDCQLVVNDYWEIAIEEGCDFVHLGQEDLAGADREALAAANLQLGISTHDARELDTALGYSPAYVALGPIYPTVLKKMPWSPQGLGRISEWKKHISETPLVAIGGLSVERAAAVFDAGADIVSVVTDVSLHPEPEDRVRQWLSATRR